MTRIYDLQTRLFGIVLVLIFSTLLVGCNDGSNSRTPPIVSTVSPTSGSTSGNTVVTLTGSGFTGAYQVTFGGTAGTSLVVNSDTQITVTSPAGAAGAVNVKVTNTTNSGTANDAYTYVTPGSISTVAGTGTAGSTGDGAAATAARISGQVGIAFDSVGNLYIADTNNQRIRVVAKTTGTYFGVAMTADNIYTVAGTTGGSSGDGAAAIDAKLNGPFGVAFDSVGNMYIPDLNNNRIRVVANTTGTYFGVAMTAGNIYTLAGNGTGSSTGDGAAATAATINGPVGLGFDSDGNLYIAEHNSSRIRVIAKTTGTYFGVAMTADNIYKVAGTTVGLSGDGSAATSAQISGPYTVTFDSVGNMYISDKNNHRIRVVAKTTGTYFGVAMTANSIYTVAGTSVGLSGDSAGATAAKISQPKSVAFDSVGNMYIADASNHRIRVVAKTTGTYLGVATIANNIYTLAGTTSGFSGDGSAATAAQLNGPVSAAFDSVGNLYISDSGNNRIRKVTP